MNGTYFIYLRYLLKRILIQLQIANKIGNAKTTKAIITMIPSYSNGTTLERVITIAKIIIADIVSLVIWKKLKSNWLLYLLPGQG